jgi:transcription antitermination factor NusG
MVGTIESISGQKVKVSVSIFGRKTPVELDMMQIDKM